MSINVWRPVETVLTSAARLAWPAFQAVNRRFESSTFQPKWAPAPLLKSRERTKPPLGWPRIDRFAVPDLRQGSAPADPLRRAVDRDAGQRARRRDQGADRRARRPGDRREDLPDARHLHRHAGDRPGVPRRASRTLFPGRDFQAVTDTLHNHGTSSIQYGRGVGPHDRPDQPLQHDVRSVLHGRQPGRLRPRADASTRSRSCSTTRITIKPRRQMTVQFSGGEPTISPIFLDAVALRARGRLLQRAGRDQRHPLRAGAGVRAQAARRPGMRIAYLQFDGVGEEANAHRKVGNLFDVKLRAIENLHAAGIDVVPRRHHRQHGEQRPGRADRQVRAGELRQDQLRVVPAGVVHRPRRGHLRRRSRTRSATRCRTSRRT